MSDSGAGRPAARAIAPPADPSHGDLSGPRLAAARSEAPTTTPGRPIATDWAMATAPTLLLKPVDGESDDAASTSRIPTVPPMTDDTASTSRIPTSPPMAGLEEQPWFKTGTTMPPPSMRPSGESMMPAPRKPPNPRVLKIVFGVIAGCLFIVAIAGVKLVYKRVTAPPAPAATAETSAPKTALAEPTKTPSSENAPAASPPPSAPEPAPAAAPVAATAESAQRAAVRSTTPRAPAKTTTRRAPAPKKPVRGTH